MAVEDPDYHKMEMEELNERDLDSFTEKNVKDEDNSGRDLGTIYRRWDFIVFLAAVSLKIPFEYAGQINMGATYADTFIVYVISYVVLMLLIGVPLMLLELFIGQQFGSGILNVWKKSPSFKGIGILIMIGLVFLNITYSIFTTIQIGLVSEAAVNKELPWVHCDNDYNTQICKDDIIECGFYHKFQGRGINYTSNIDNTLYDNDPYHDDYSHVCLVKEFNSNLTLYNSYDLQNPIEQYSNVFFDGSRGIVNTFSVFNVTTLLVTWALVCVILIRGINKLKETIGPLIIVFLILLFVYFIQNMILLSNKQLKWSDGINFHQFYEGIELALIAVFTYQNMGAPMMILIGGTIPRKQNILSDFLIIIGIQIVLTCVTMWCVSIHSQFNDHIYVGQFFQELVGYKSNLSAAFHLITNLIPAFIYIVILSQAFVTALEHAYPFIKEEKRRKIFIGVFCGCSFFLGLMSIAFSAMQVYYTLHSPLDAAVHIISFLMCLYMSVGIGHKKFLADLRETYGNNKFLTFCYGCWVVVIPTVCCIKSILFVVDHVIYVPILQIILFFLVFTFPLIYMLIVKCCCGESANFNCCKFKSPLQIVLISVGSSVLVMILLSLGASYLGLI